MEILAIIGIVLLFIIIYVGGGLLGWVIKGFEETLDFLSDGCSHSLGCLAWIILIVLLLISLIV